MPLQAEDSLVPKPGLNQRQVEISLENSRTLPFFCGFENTII